MGALTPGVFSEADEGILAFDFTSEGLTYRVLFDDYVSATEFTGRLLSDLPDALKNTFTLDWAYARKTFDGFSHLADKQILVVADGIRQETVTVSSAGEVTLSDYASKISGGLTYTSKAQTLPFSMEIEAGAQGRSKSLSQVFIRVDSCGAVKVGSSDADLKVVEGLSDTLLRSGEFRTSVPSTWGEDGQVVIESSGPAPATVLNITAQVSIGD